MAKRVLPITTNPIVECNLTLMFQFSILQSSQIDVLPWIVSQFTNIQYDPNVGDKFEFVREANWFPKDKVFHRHFYSLKTDFKDSNLFDILDIIRSLLDDEYYVNGAFDSYYVPNSDNYRIIHCIKNYLIYGYDDYIQKFSIISYTNDYNYESFEIEYSVLIAAIKNRSDNTIIINGIKVNPEHEFVIRNDRIQNGLYDFLHSCHREAYLSLGGKKIFGQLCLSEFKNYLNNIGYMCEFIRRDSYCTIYDYLLLMCLRMEVLIKNNTIPNDMSTLIDELRIYANDFKRNCEIYNTTRDISVLKSIIDVFDISTALTLRFAETAYSILYNGNLENGINQ